MEENSKKNSTISSIVISPLLLSIVFVFLLIQHARDEVLFIFFIVMVVDTISMNVVLLKAEDSFQNSGVANLVYAFLYVFYSALPMFKQPFRQSQYTYICIATAVVLFVFSLYFLTQYRLHRDTQRSRYER